MAEREQAGAGVTIEELRERTTLTVPEAGRVLGFGSDSAAYRSAANGTMPGVRRLGTRIVVSAPALLDFLLNGDQGEEGGDVVRLRTAG